MIQEEPQQDWQVIMSSTSGGASLSGDIVDTSPAEYLRNGTNAIRAGLPYAVIGEEFWNVERLLDCRTGRKGRRGRLPDHGIVGTGKSRARARYM